VEFGVSEAADFAGLAFPDDGGLVASADFDVAVEAVLAEVHLAADEPFGVGEIPVEHFIPRLEPVEFFRDSSPEGFGIFDGSLVHLFILLEGFDVCFLGEFGRRRKDAGFAKERVEILTGEG
jgi:hypothetical protein